MNFENLRDNNLMVNPALAIKAGTSPTASHGRFVYKIDKTIYAKAAGDLPALTGTIADDFKAIYKFVIDAAGTISVEKSDDVAITSNIDTTNFADGNEQGFGHDDTEAVVGYILVDNQTGSTFTGGTTALDTANLTVDYIDGTEVFGR